MTHRGLTERIVVVKQRAASERSERRQAMGVGPHRGPQ
jgi:hypothetical protein